MTINVPGWFLVAITIYLCVDSLMNMAVARARKRLADVATAKATKAAFDIESYIAEQMEERTRD